MQPDKVEVRAIGGIQRFVLAAPEACSDIASIVAWANELPGTFLPAVGVHDPWFVWQTAGLTWELRKKGRSRRALAWVDACPLAQWEAKLRDKAVAALESWQIPSDTSNSAEDATDDE